MFKRSSHKVPSLNTTSTADISFMLLIFFLVTTSMDVDKGITRILPPINKEQKEVKKDIERSNILQVELHKDGTLTIDDKTIKTNELRGRVREFVSTADREQYVIAVKTSREAQYQRYFDVQNEILAAYRELREQRAQQLFHHPLSQCTQEQRDSIKAYYPQRIAEDVTEKGGAE